MEINILEEKNNKIKFEIRGEDHTFCNILREELWNNKEVEVSGYNIDHPLVSSPVMIVETKKENPRKSLIKATENLRKKFQELESKFKNLK